MANPTNLEVFGVNDAAVATILTALNLPATTDARLAAYSIVELLFTNLAVIVETEGDLLTYKITKDIANVDLETQLQTFNAEFRLAITAVTMSSEE